MTASVRSPVGQSLDQSGPATRSHVSRQPGTTTRCLRWPILPAGRAPPGRDSDTAGRFPALVRAHHFRILRGGADAFGATILMDERASSRIHKRDYGVRPRSTRRQPRPIPRAGGVALRNLTRTARLVQEIAWACTSSSTPSSHRIQGLHRLRDGRGAGPSNWPHLLWLQAAGARVGRGVDVRSCS